MIPTRTEFFLLPSWQVWLFYGLVAVAMFDVARMVWLRVRAWRQGKPIGWKYQAWRNVWREVLNQRTVRANRRRSGAPMHVIMFVGFLGLFIGTSLLALNTYSPIKFHHGTYYVIYEAALDLAGAAFVVGVVWALVRRIAFRPRHAASTAADLVALVLLLFLGVTGFLVEAARMALAPHGYDSSAPVGHLLARALVSISQPAFVTLWWIHVAGVIAFFALLPRTRLRHALLAIFSAAGREDRALGRLRSVDIAEVEQTGQIGVKSASDLSRWHLLSLDACMECGRCSELCPATGVGKPLDPKRVVQSIRGTEGREAAIADAVGHEELFDCTTCGACVVACPAGIRHTDLIVDARRFLVAEGQLRGSGATMLRQAGSTSHAWGAQPDAREDWMKGEDVPLARDGAPFDVLLWVGCAGASDAGATSATRATARLLHLGGVRFACLGREELCTGDAVRRLGEEFLFQDLAQRNVATFAKYGVKKIVTPCAHCFNTLKHEYSDFEGHYEVLHHTQALADLVDGGKLRPATSQTTVFHDPCYLARANGETQAPRALLGAIRAPEPAQTRAQTLCCGAGGGRMWMDEAPDRRPGDRRATDLLATGADSVAVACPFCRIMLDSSVKQVEQRVIPVRDVAEFLLEANT